MYYTCTIIYPFSYFSAEFLKCIFLKMTELYTSVYIFVSYTYRILLTIFINKTEKWTYLFFGVWLYF